jgi:hypothetical protein
MKYQNNPPALFASRPNRRVFVSKSLATLAGAAAAVMPPPPVNREAFAQAGGQEGTQAPPRRGTTGGPPAAAVRREGCGRTRRAGRRHRQTFPGLPRDENRHFGRHHQRPDRWQRPAAPGHARLSADPCGVAPHGARSRGTFHCGARRPAASRRRAKITPAIPSARWRSTRSGSWRSSGSGSSPWSAMTAADELPIGSSSINRTGSKSS